MDETHTATATQAHEEAKDDSALLVVDIGKKQKRKRIRQLRKGRGRLLDEITAALADMKEQGAIGDDAQPVVFIVREKRRRWGRGLW